MSSHPALTAGVDEVGRGPLAGPLIAAAVILPEKFELIGLTDSKRLSPPKRAELSTLIKQQAVCWSIGRSEVDEIDRVNVFHATLLAMQRAVEALPVRPGLSLVDGKWAPELVGRTKTIIKGDLTEPSISAASILAKVARDAEMCELHEDYPGYGFNANKGYPTRVHLNALVELGPCEIHRRSFSPVRAVLHLR